MSTRSNAVVLMSIAVLATTLSLNAQTAGSARIVRAERGLTLNGQPVAAGSSSASLGDVANLQTTEGRAVIALKRGGTLVLGSNTSVRIRENAPYNFNRVELLTGSAVLLSASSSGVVACGTDASLSTDGVFRFDVLDPERTDGSQRCRIRVREGAASTNGGSMPYVLRAGQEMVMNVRAGDMMPVLPLAGALDDLDRWAREQGPSR